MSDIGNRDSYGDKSKGVCVWFATTDYRSPTFEGSSNVSQLTAIANKLLLAELS